MILVVELLPSNGEVVEILNDYHDISIPQDDLTLRFNELLPNFDKNKTNLQKLINTLNQAVYNTMLKGERPDYSDLATPSLRANEYYLYKILQDRGIMQESSDKYGFGIFFKENTEGVYEIKQKHEDKLLSEEKTFINELYNFYYNNRHTLLHFDKEPKLTRVLKSMEEARSLIISNLELIDKYYTVF
nr:RNase LS family HEPN domain-containing protein [Bacillus sp. UTDS19-33BHI26]